MPAQPIKIQSFLQNLPLFNELVGDEIDRIAAGTREVHASRGTVLFHRGDACQGFHVVVFGQVKLAFNSPQGAEKVIEIIGPGQSFGEALMFLEKPYIVYAQTLADSLLLYVSKSVVFEGLERDPGFARKIIAGLSRRLHGLIRDVEGYSLRSGAQRVIGYLLQGEEGAEAGGNALEVVLPANKNVIASRLNLTPEHFSRILHELSAAKLIEVDGRTIRIPDVPRLSRFEG